MKQQLKVRLEQDVITGFSYSFTKALLEKLKQTQKKIKTGRLNGYALTTDCVMRHLQNQLLLSGKSIEKFTTIEQAIGITEEFLAIFEEKGETIAVPRKELGRILDTVALAEGKARRLINSAEAVKLLKKAHTKIDELLKG